MFGRDESMNEEGAAVANPPAPVVTADEVVELWLGDLIHNIPALRETDNYNKLRSAVDDLKSKLQHG